MQNSFSLKCRLFHSTETIYQLAKRKNICTCQNKHGVFFRTEEQKQNYFLSNNRFFTKKQNRFYNIYWRCHGNGTYVGYTIQELKFLSLTLPFSASKGSKVLDKKVKETLVSKTVFSHLKWSNLSSRKNTSVVSKWM